MPENSTAIRRGLKSPVAAAILSAAVTGSVVGGVAIAQTSGPAVITACVTETTGSVRIVSSAADCRTNERPTTWNQQGPQGEPGPPGPAPFVKVLSKSSGPGECQLKGEFGNECAAVTVHVPPNQTYAAVINSAGTAVTREYGHVAICPSARRVDQASDGARCWAPTTGVSGPVDTTEQAVAANGAAVLTGGPSGADWIVSTGVITVDPSRVEASVTTIVTVSEGQVTFGGA